MKTTCGSREMYLESPSPQELRAATGLGSIHPETHRLLLQVFEMGAKAALEQIENSRGARLERTLMEES